MTKSELIEALKAVPFEAEVVVLVFDAWEDEWFRHRLEEVRVKGDVVEIVPEAYKE